MKQRLYVFSNTFLRRKQNTLFFETVCSEQKVDEDEEFDEIHINEDEYYLSPNSEPMTNGNGKYMPVENIDSIFSIGTVHFNSQFLYFLSRNKIPMHIFNYRGAYAGSFVPAERMISGNVLIKQVDFYNNAQKRLFIAKQFVDGTAHNTLCNLKYHQNKKACLQDYIDYISEIASMINTARSIDELMGYEGMIKKAYYDAWKEIFVYPVDFNRRVKNPPNNLINALISYGNMIVYGVCINEIYQTRLYPEISYLHEPGDCRLSLSFDIAEMFKPLLTDRIIFKVINKNMISEKDAFIKNGTCRLSKNAKQIFSQEFEIKLNTKISLLNSDKRISYKGIIRQECYKLHKHINNEETYKAYKSKW